MKNLKKLAAMLLIAVLSLSVLAGCSSDNNEETTDPDTEETEDVEEAEETDKDDDTEKPKVSIGYVNWADDVAMTELAKAVLEDKMGYEVEAVNAEAGVIFTSLADGSTDFFLDLWLPVTHQDYYEEYEEDLVKLGLSYDAARIGLVVPEYVEIDSIAELEENKEMFEGQIVGIDSGAGVMQSTEEVLETYDIDMELVTGSEPTMVASLQEAIDNEEPVVVTAWDPHWKFAKWDLKFLEDPENVFGDGEESYTVARTGTEEDMPEVHEFFEKFHMEVSDVEDLMKVIEEGDNIEEDVKGWMDEHEEIIEPWLPEEK